LLPAYSIASLMPADHPHLLAFLSPNRFLGQYGFEVEKREPVDSDFSLVGRREGFTAGQSQRNKI
jgi:hypothetical protein